MPDPISLTTVGASITATFKLADFALSVQRAPEDIKIFSRLIKRVSVDRAEALQDFKDLEALFEEHPKKKEWIIGIINDTNRVLEKIGETVENARIDGVKGRSVTFQHKIEWVFSKKERVLILQHWLSTCHQSLLAAIGYMQGLQAASTLQTPTVLPVLKVDGDGDETVTFLRSPYSRRPKKKPSSQLLEIDPPTYSRTLTEDLERAFQAVESFVSTPPCEQQVPVPERDPRKPPNNIVPLDDGLNLPIPVSLERTPSADYRRRRRDAYLGYDET